MNRCRLRFVAGLSRHRFIQYVSFIWSIIPICWFVLFLYYFHSASMKLFEVHSLNLHFFDFLFKLKSQTNVQSSLICLVQISLLCFCSKKLFIQLFHIGQSDYYYYSWFLSGFLNRNWRKQAKIHQEEFVPVCTYLLLIDTYKPVWLLRIKIVSLCLGWSASSAWYWNTETEGMYVTLLFPFQQ